MSYKTIIWLNIASVIEAIVIGFLIRFDYVICNAEVVGFYGILALVAVKNMLVLGGYQMYFWSQKNHIVEKKVCLRITWIDRKIPAIPEFFWIYSPVYYVFFTLSILCLKNFNSIALNSWIMLMHSSFWFVYFPTGIKKEFRDQVRSVKTDRVTRFIMNLVHQHDSEENACPSMHCAFAVFLAFVMYPFYPVVSVIFPFFVSLSCLFTKQHTVIDILPGFALGALHGYINSIFL